jgi:uncharacterized protein YukE
MYVSYVIGTARDVQTRMSRRTAEMRTWLDDLERLSQRTRADWDGQTEIAYAAAKQEWDRGAKEAQTVFDLRIATWGRMIDRIEEGDRLGASAISL